jgi:starch synthase (maltosyl-transferring)
MGFNCIYLNPFHELGESSSIYSIKDYYRYNQELFANTSVAELELKLFIDYCHANGILVIMDLVINHCAIDSVLVNENRDWFFFDKQNKPLSPKTLSIEDNDWIVWSDLAKFNYENTSKDNLWLYFLGVCKHYIEVGFDGFRCDAANHITPKFWKFLISDLAIKFKAFAMLWPSISIFLTCSSKLNFSIP